GRPGSGAHRVVALCGPYLSGKTSLLESILYATGAIGRRGSTRAGTSIGDGAAEARKLGMSTELNIASVDYLGDQWTFVDAPGWIEFQHDAFAALAACDAGDVVCEPAPERAAALSPRLTYSGDPAIPHIFIINKIDSADARVRALLSGRRPVHRRAPAPEGHAPRPAGRRRNGQAPRVAVRRSLVKFRGDGRVLQGPPSGPHRQALALPGLVGRLERRPEPRRPAHRRVVP